MRVGLLSNPLGWVDKVGDKVGRLLSDQSPARRVKKLFPGEIRKSDLQDDPPESDSEKHRSGAPKGPKDKDSDFQGPDTSSLTAFLLSLLSCTETSPSGDNPATSSGDHVQAKDGDSIVGSTSTSMLDGRLQQPAETRGEGILLGETNNWGELGVRGRETGRGLGDDVDEADWQLVCEHDLAGSRMVDNTPVEAMLPSQLPYLPAMTEESSLLSESLRGFLCSALPTLAKGRQWVLLYSTEKHGISLLTLYRKSNILPGPCLLVAGDRQGAVFGGLMTAPLKPTPKKKYQGTSESFVFTNVVGHPKIFRPTGLNRYFVLCTTEGLAFGGGGHFALHLDSDLLHGTSGACETYGSCCLSHTEDFTLKNVELWGFAHTSRYVPRYASFKEPEEMPGVCRSCSSEMEKEGDTCNSTWL